jgi:hypothetical protein
VRTRGSKLRRKTSLQNCQILENLLGNIEIFPSQNPIFLNRFPTFFNGFLLSSTAFRFLQQLSAFFNGFPLSSTAFCFLQRPSAFFNYFLLSSMAFCFLQWLSAFFNGFPLSSTAFRFLQRLSAFFNGFPLSSTAFCRRELLISLSVSDQIIPNNLISHKWELNSVERFCICGCLLKSRNKNSDRSKFVGQLNGQNMCYHECLSDS